MAVILMCTGTAQAQAQTACQQREFEQCRQEQMSRPDSARGGQSVTQFCTNLALMRCAGTSQ